MSILSIILIAISLAIDAFAVSIAIGSVIRILKIRHATRVGLFFGLFQGIMPIIGWGAGNSFIQYIDKAGPLVAFGILLFIGGKMIYESRKMESSSLPADPLSFLPMLMFAVATSIDALGVGFSFSLIHVTVIMPAIIISVITFLMSFAGVYIGDHLGHLFENKIELAAGVILIIVGVKILLENWPL
ncbi:MAG: manganese efflux pump MntP family protein [Candidatus Marinimicrobia bacterium]|nr:manganese efflux pump MntP family protein [Candidatus Neomarinimicrobiota bacterium]